MKNYSIELTDSKECLTGLGSGCYTRAVLDHNTTVAFRIKAVNYTAAKEFGERLCKNLDYFFSCAIECN